MMSLVDIILGVSKGAAAAGTGIITGKILSDKTDLDTNQIVMISSGTTVATYAALTGVQEIVMSKIEDKQIAELLEEFEDDSEDAELDEAVKENPEVEEDPAEEVPEATEEPVKEETPVAEEPKEEPKEPNAFEVFEEKKPAPKKRPSRSQKK